MTAQPSTTTVDALRAEAVQNAGSLHARLAPLRDRADLPAAAAELIRSGTERERIIALLALREAAHRGQAVAEPALLALADSLPKVRVVAVRTLGIIGWSGARAALESAIHDRIPAAARRARLRQRGERTDQPRAEMVPAAVGLSFGDEGFSRLSARSPSSRTISPMLSSPLGDGPLS